MVHVKFLNYRQQRGLDNAARMTDSGPWDRFWTQGLARSC